MSALCRRHRDANSPYSTNPTRYRLDSCRCMYVVPVPKETSVTINVKMFPRTDLHGLHAGPFAISTFDAHRIR